MNRWISVLDGTRIVDPDTPQKTKRHHRLVLIHQVGQIRQQVSIDVAPPTVVERRNLRHKVTCVTHCKLDIAETRSAFGFIQSRRRPETLQHDLAHVRRPLLVVFSPFFFTELAKNVAVADQTAMPEHFVIQYVVASRKEIGPVTSLGNLQHATIIRVQRTEPIHRAL